MQKLFETIRNQLQADENLVTIGEQSKKCSESGGSGQVKSTTIKYIFALFERGIFETYPHAAVPRLDSNMV